MTKNQFHCYWMIYTVQLQEINKTLMEGYHEKENLVK